MEINQIEEEMTLLKEESNLKILIAMAI